MVVKLKSCLFLFLLITLYIENAATFKRRPNILPKKFPVSERNVMLQEPFSNGASEYRDKGKNALSSLPEHVVRAQPERSPRIPRNVDSSAAEPEIKAENKPEPVPDWPIAFKTWGKAWNLHMYLFLAIYILLAAIAVIALAHDLLTNHAMKGLKLTLYLTLLFIGCSRAVILFIDPYSSRGTLNYHAAYITWSLGFPCILTALGLLLLVFMEVTKMDLIPPRFQKLSTALGLMFFNLLVNFVIDVILLLTEKVLLLKIICRSYFLIFGFILTMGFLFIGFRFSRSAVESIYGDKGLTRLRAFAFILSALNLLFLGIQIYSIIQFDSTEISLPWPWYALQTSLRGLEASICLLMFCIIFNNRVGMLVSCWRKVLPNRFRNAVLPFTAAAS